ncbi:glyoxalase [Streptomyces sp. NPDC048659]|uniref:glyoxalase n=1 Tax=Streptomyces sp. NPDC048659 TaxID=3155489 RepID=UPI0034356451
MATTTSHASTAALSTVTLEVTDPAAAGTFLAALGLDTRIALRASDAPTQGFRGWALALTVPGPATVDAFVADAVAAGATVVKPAARSLWGYGAVVQAPDGTLWKIATGTKKDTGPATRAIDGIVLLLGVGSVKATREFYVSQGLTVARSFGGKYTEFTGTPGAVTLALYKHRALAKELGVPAEGTGSHRLTLTGTGTAFTDPDGFAWEA